jgi:5-methylcytosine-specific restriction endonuclease McrA
VKSLVPPGASLPLAGPLREGDGNRPGWMRGSRWMKLRRVVIADQHGVCADCNQAAIQEVHHIVRVADDPTAWGELDNLVGLCKACHTGRHARDACQVDL